MTLTAYPQMQLGYERTISRSYAREIARRDSPPFPACSHRGHVRQGSALTRGVHLPWRAQLHGVRHASRHSGHGENSVGSENLHVLGRCGVFIMNAPSATPMPAISDQNRARPLRSREIARRKFRAPAEYFVR